MPPLNRAPSLAAILGGSLWSLAWLLNGQTFDDTRAVFGLHEGHYRAMLNPLVLLLLFALWRLYRIERDHLSRSGRAGFVLLAAGMAAFVAGNLFEFGLLGKKWLPHIGWLIVLAAIAVMAAGMLILGISLPQPSRLPTWAKRLLLAMGVAAAAGFFGVPQLFTYGFGLGWIGLGIAMWPRRG